MIIIKGEWNTIFFRTNFNNKQNIINNDDDDDDDYDSKTRIHTHTHTQTNQTQIHHTNRVQIFFIFY